MNDAAHAIEVADMIEEMRAWRKEEARRIELIVTPADEADADAFRVEAQTDPWRIDTGHRWASVRCDHADGRGEAVAKALAARGWSAFADGGQAHVRDPRWVR